MRDVWVVLPTYNEADNLEPVVTRLLDVLGPDGGRVLVADDNSPDGTGPLADELARRHPGRVEVLHRPGRGGLGRAYVAAMTHALDRGAEAVVQMDADLSHDPADVRRLLAALADGADVALGTRYMTGGGTVGWPRRRQVVSRSGGAYARAVLGLDVRDPTGGFKAFRGSALRRIDLASVRSDGYAFQIETTYRALREGLTVAEVPIVFRDREAGASKMSLSVALEAAWRIPALRLEALQRGRIATPAAMSSSRTSSIE